jgi:hypothetical protein
MRILVRHGHFAFFPKNTKDVARFSRFFDQELVREDDYYTFEGLAGLPRFSLTGLAFGDLPALTTYEGRGPWEVMRENNFVFNVDLGILVPKLSITKTVQPILIDSYFISPAPLFQPGSRDSSGQQILSYDGEFMLDTSQLRMLEVSYE